MTRKTYSMEKDGIYVTGHTSKSAAQKAWIEARDTFVKRAAECGVWSMSYNGWSVTVSPLPSGSWQYVIAGGLIANGVKIGDCYFGADTQVQAIAVGVNALAQRMWDRSVPDDAEYYDAIVATARLRPEEARNGRSDFLYCAEHWRAHPVAA